MIAGQADQCAGLNISSGRAGKKQGRKAGRPAASERVKTLYQFRGGLRILNVKTDSPQKALSKLMTSGSQESIGANKGLRKEDAKPNPRICIDWILDQSRSKITTWGHFEKGRVEVSLFRHPKHPALSPSRFAEDSAWFDPSLVPLIRPRSSNFLFKLSPTHWRRSCDKEIFELFGRSIYRPEVQFPRV